MKSLAFFPLIFYLSVFQSFISAQSNDDIAKPYVQQLDKGKIDEVKLKLPELVSQYQNNPGILYLQGRVAADGAEAVKYYQMILENYPQSEWADDALYRIYQYYYALGLYKTAEQKKQQLKKEYPGSRYLSGKKTSDLSDSDESFLNIPAKKTQPGKEGVLVKDSTVASDSEGVYTLQVGAFSTPENAGKLKDLFEGLNYTVEITNKVRVGKSLYLVWVGNYKSIDEAKKIAQGIRTRYKLNPIILERY